VEEEAAAAKAAKEEAVGAKAAKKEAAAVAKAAHEEAAAANVIGNEEAASSIILSPLRPWTTQSFRHKLTAMRARLLCTRAFPKQWQAMAVATTAWTATVCHCLEMRR
jgi:hypothetical protein